MEPDLLQPDGKSITGLIVPTAWDTTGMVTALVIATPFEEEYVIDEPEDVTRLLLFRDHTVRVQAEPRSRVPGRQQVIRINRVVEYSSNP